MTQNPQAALHHTVQIRFRPLSRFVSSIRSYVASERCAIPAICVRIHTFPTALLQRDSFQLPRFSVPHRQTHEVQRPSPSYNSRLICAAENIDRYRGPCADIWKTVPCLQRLYSRPRVPKRQPRYIPYGNCTHTIPYTKKWKANKKQDKGIMESGSPVLIADVRWQEGPSQYPYSLQPPILLRFEHTSLCCQKECATSCNPILAHTSGMSLCRQKSGHIRYRPTVTIKYHLFSICVYREHLCLQKQKPTHSVQPYPTLCKDSVLMSPGRMRHFVQPYFGAYITNVLMSPERAKSVIRCLMLFKFYVVYFC